MESNGQPLADGFRTGAPVKELPSGLKMCPAAMVHPDPLTVIAPSCSLAGRGESLFCITILTPPRVSIGQECRCMSSEEQEMAWQ